MKRDISQARTSAAVGSVPPVRVLPSYLPRDHDGTPWLVTQRDLIWICRDL